MWFKRDMRTKRTYKPDRLTTREAALHLGCTISEALQLLRASRITCTKAGSAFLWDAKEVERLRRVLDRTPGDQEAGT